MAEFTFGENTNSIFEILADNGIDYTDGKGKFFCVIDDKLFVNIVYSKVIPINNSYIIYRENGVKIDISTKEHCHLNYPHIHAIYNGERISIGLDNFEIEGTFKNPSKQKVAINYVKKHQRELKRIWNDTIIN